MNDQAFQTLHYRISESGVAFVGIDVADRKVNVLTPELHREIGQVADRLASDESAKGAVIYSEKPSFLAGGDLKRIVRFYDMNRSAAEAYEQSREYTVSLRKLETCGKPVAVAINGNALGGGLELALACHYRVMVDDPEALIGLPEVTLGLIPGGGGTQRLPRLIGLQQAVSLVVSGKTMNPEAARELGIVDALAPEADLLGKAEQWVLDHPDAQQPWDKRGFSIPGGSGLSNLDVARLLSVSTARIGAKYRHNYPAPIAALRSIANGTTVHSMDAALEVETREFSKLTRDPVARNIIRTLFINKRERRFRKKDSNQNLARRCIQAYTGEGERMRREGVSTALIENCGLHAGMREGPLAMSGQGTTEHGGNGSMDPQTGRFRLLAIQSLAALDAWENEETDPVEADLSSVLGWGFPSYTGGVVSYIDTMGVGAFIAACDALADAGHGQFRPTDWLRDKGSGSDRIYPPET